MAAQQGDRGCVINDDMQKLYDAIEHADALVLGSPIYMGQMSAQAKIFTDRLFAQHHSAILSAIQRRNAGKKLILVFNQGNPDSRLFQSYFDYTKHIFQLLEFDVKVVPVVAGMRNGPAHERKDLHTAMKDIGSSLVLELRNDSSLRKEGNTLSDCTAKTKNGNQSKPAKPTRTTARK